MWSLTRQPPRSWNISTAAQTDGRALCPFGLEHSDSSAAHSHSGSWCVLPTNEYSTQYGVAHTHTRTLLRHCFPLLAVVPSSICRMLKPQQDRGGSLTVPSRLLGRSFGLVSVFWFTSCHRQSDIVFHPLLTDAGAQVSGCVLTHRWWTPTPRHTGSVLTTGVHREGDFSSGGIINSTFMVFIWTLPECVWQISLGVPWRDTCLPYLMKHGPDKSLISFVCFVNTFSCKRRRRSNDRRQ